MGSIRPNRRDVVLAAVLAATPAPGPAMAGGPDRRALGEDVKREMAWAWANYAERALGQDQIKPVSRGAEPFFFPDRPMGLSIVEAFGALW